MPGKSVLLVLMSVYGKGHCCACYAAFAVYNNKFAGLNVRRNVIVRGVCRVSFDDCDYKTRSRFLEGDRVKFVRDDWPDLPVGSIGVVRWVYYWPLYEVTFTDSDGLVFDNTYGEGDLSEVGTSAV